MTLDRFLKSFRIFLCTLKRDPPERRHAIEKGSDSLSDPLPKLQYL